MPPLGGVPTAMLPHRLVQTNYNGVATKTKCCWAVSHITIVMWSESYSEAKTATLNNKSKSLEQKM